MKNRKIDKDTTTRIYCKNKPFVHIKNTTNGITIIALVITIVLLLILAGVTIASFTGDKGVLNETKNMKNNVEELQNKTLNDLHEIANDLSTSAGDALNP